MVINKNKRFYIYLFCIFTLFISYLLGENSSGGSIIDNIKGININKDPRGREKPSDHTPIEINLA